MIFSEEMKMMLQIRQLALKEQKTANLRAVQEDYGKLVQKIVSDLETQIRSDIAEGRITLIIEGDADLPLTPMILCGKIPELEEPSDLFAYQMIGGLPHFCWAPLCSGIYDGKRMASKNVRITLTDAGKRLLNDISDAAQADGVLLTFRPAILTKKGKVILNAFGQYENIPGLHHGKKGVLCDYFVNMHYEIP